MAYILKGFSLFTKNNGVVNGTITLDDFNHIFSFSDEELAKKIEEDEQNYKYGLSFNEYLYSCFLSYNDGLDFDNCLLNKMKPIKDKYEKEVEYIFFIDEFLTKNEKVKKDYIDFEINSELSSELNRNMNPNYSTEERILYYYFKMCMLFEYDDVYNFSHMISKYSKLIGFKKSPNRLSHINSDNNQVSCFEFDALLTKLIIKEGGIVNISHFTGDSQHVCTQAIINRRYYKFDALESPVEDDTVSGDIINVKLGEKYSGVCTNLDDLLNGKITYYPYVEKIYEDVLREMLSDSQKFNPDSLDYCFYAIDNLDVSGHCKEKIKEHFLSFNKYPLTGSATYFSNIVMHNDVKDDNLELIGVCSTIQDYRLGLILSVHQDNDKYMYFYFGEDDDIKVFNEEKMTELISENKIIITKSETAYDDKYRFIPGIDFELQKNMWNNARTNLLPALFEKTYNDSCGEKVLKKVLNIS